MSRFHHREARPRPVRTILVIGAVPYETWHLRLDAECEAIREGIRGSRCRESFAVESVFAANQRQVRRAILDYNPSFVHFCGHGVEGGGLVFEGQEGESQVVSVLALESLFRVFAEDVHCFVLNSCYSGKLAKVLVRYVAHAVGTAGAIEDQAAIEYSRAFYDTIGAGRTVEDAHEIGIAAIHWEGLATPQLPKLFTRNGSALGGPRTFDEEDESVRTNTISLDSFLRSEALVSLPVRQLGDHRVLSLHVGSSLILGRCFSKQLRSSAATRIHAAGSSRVDWVVAWDNASLNQVITKQCLTWRGTDWVLEIESLTDYSRSSQDMIYRAGSRRQETISPGQTLSDLFMTGEEIELRAGMPEKRIVDFSLHVENVGGWKVPIVSTKNTSFPANTLEDGHPIQVSFYGIWIPMEPGRLGQVLADWGQSLRIYIADNDDWISLSGAPKTHQVNVSASPEIDLAPGGR